MEDSNKSYKKHTQMEEQKMVTVVDMKTMMVMDVHTDEGSVSYPSNRFNEESEFGMPLWDYD